VTKGLQIDRAFNGLAAGRKAGLWLEPSGIDIPWRWIARTPRIGVGYAGDWAEKPLRYVVDPQRLPTMRKQAGEVKL
jgi:DNA-3-methyladenine glycosylase